MIPNKLSIALHKSGEHATVSYDSEDNTRTQLIVPVSELPAELRQNGQYVRQPDGSWRRTVRLDGDEAIRALRTLFGEA
jgi:hypothetical protein